MKITELLLEDENNVDINLIDILEDFLPFMVKELQLQTIPKIKLVSKVDDNIQPTFGRYEDQEQVVYLSIKNRHPLDIIRTLAHECVHHKQNIENKLGPHSGETGSDEENQAHELAGIVMRNFNKLHPQYFNANAVEI
jgi:hypothetical protein